jgi:hypothetical protein
MLQSSSMQSTIETYGALGWGLEVREWVKRLL